MKKHVYFFLIFSIFSHLFLSAADMGKTRLAILPFSSMGGIEKATLEIMSENFTIAMVDAGVYNIVERGQLDQALKELKFQRGDIFDDSSAAKLGKMVGAEIVIFGTVSYAEDNYFINARGIDVTTGVVVFGKREQTRNKNELFTMTDKLANSISFGNNEKAGNKKRRDASSSVTGKYSEADQRFMEKWSVFPDNYEDTLSKYKISTGIGIGLAAGGGTILLTGLIVWFGTLGYFSTTWGRHTYGSSEMTRYNIAYTTYWEVALPIGVVFTILGITALSLCSIPFWFANKVASLYKKATGEKLSFLERTKFDLRIVTKKESLTNEYNRKISFDLSISL